MQGLAIAGLAVLVVMFTVGACVGVYQILFGPIEDDERENICG